MNYPTSKKVKNYLLFFVDQLQYEVLSGRESACLLLKTLFQKLPKVSHRLFGWPLFVKFNLLTQSHPSFPLPDDDPQSTIDQNNSALFFALGVRLVNEDDTDIRTLVAECIETLLKRLDPSEKSSLVKIIQDMLGDRLLKHRELGTQLLLRILHSQPTERFIRSWLPNVLPALLQNLVPPTSAALSADGKFVKPLAPSVTLLTADPSGDHLIIQTQNVFAELLRLQPAMLTAAQYNDTIDALAYTAQSLLSSGHQWVRFGALKLLYQIMNELDFDAIHERIRYLRSKRNDAEPEAEEELDSDDNPGGRQFLFQSPLRDCKTLTLDLCAQLSPHSAMVSESDDEAAGLVTQLLFLIANILRAVPLEKKEKASSKRINLHWLVRRVRYVVQGEIFKTPHIFTLVRTLPPEASPKGCARASGSKVSLSMS